MTNANQAHHYENLPHALDYLIHVQKDHHLGGVQNVLGGVPRGFHQKSRLSRTPYVRKVMG